MNNDTVNMFHQIAEERRTIRAFLPDPVPQEVLDRCLDSALSAASSSNLQHWEYVIIRAPEIRKKAETVCFNQSGPATAPLLIAIVREIIRDGCKMDVGFLGAFKLWSAKEWESSWSSGAGRHS